MIRYPNAVFGCWCTNAVGHSANILAFGMQSMIRRYENVCWEAAYKYEEISFDLTNRFSFQNILSY